jgi:hypothetical protein
MVAGTFLLGVGAVGEALRHLGDPWANALQIGLAAGAEFDLIAFMAGRYFGMKNYGFIYGLQIGGVLAATGLAPPIFGHIQRVYGSYDPALIGAGVTFLVAPLLLLTLGRYPAAD